MRPPARRRLTARPGLAVSSLDRATERPLTFGRAGAAGDALGVSQDAPALIVRRRAVDMAERIVELRESVCLTEGYTYNVSLAASASPIP